MEAADIQFRTAALGGFSKQDVLDYIEKANKEHAARMEQLQKELSAVTDERDRLKTRVEEAEGRLVELSSQVQKLTGELADRSAELEQCRGERAVQAEEEGALRARTEELRSRLEQAEQAARSYEAIKDRTAGIELEAHCRAQSIEAAAQVQVEKARQELEQWIYKVQAGYDRMRADIEATIAHTSGELDRVRKSMEGLTAEFGDHDAELKRLLETYEEAIGPRMPDPLPLEGD